MVNFVPTMKMKLSKVLAAGLFLLVTVCLPTQQKIIHRRELEDDSTVPGNGTISTEKRELEGDSTVAGNGTVGGEKRELEGDSTAAGNETISRNKRGTHKIGVFIWSDGEIPYTIVDLPENTSDKVNETMTVIESLTCVRFIGEDNEKFQEKSQNGFLEIIKDQECLSKNGRAVSGTEAQNLKLNSNCNTRTIMHELCHAMGMKHEQRRPDRDDYVTVIEENIDPNYLSEFRKVFDVDTSLKYDISSIMQYGRTSYAINGKMAMPPKAAIYTNSQPGMEVLGGFCRGGGAEDVLSHRDIATINKLYGCADHCGSVSCDNGGYVDPNCKCQCPMGFTGDTCETFDATLVGHHQSCKESELTTNGILKPPQKGKGFKSGVSCFWRLKGAPGQKVRVKVSKMKIDKSKGSGDKTDGECDALYNEYPDWLRIYLYGSDVSVYPVSCLRNDVEAYQDEWSTSDSNQVFVRWTSVKKTATILKMTKKGKLKPVETSFNPANNIGWVLEYEFIDG